MLAFHLVSLVVFIFGAYAYGAATLLCFNQVGGVWGPNKNYPSEIRRQIDRVSLLLFGLSAIWFVFHSLIELRALINPPARAEGWLDLGTLMVYLFPPVIMHTVYLESMSEGSEPPPPVFRHLLVAMYAASPTLGALVIAAIFDVVITPRDWIGPFIGISLGVLFTLTSAYCTTVMLRRGNRVATPDQGRMRNVMIALFAVMSVLFIVMIFMQEQQLLSAALNNISRATPLYFLIASIYYENRFEFYDLVIKRATLMVMSVLAVGLYLALALPRLEQLPQTGARPWLYAVALIPLAMVMPILHARAERWLDRMWLGREFTTVEAVKHVLAAMQPATDEATLVAATESKLSEIFGARIAVLVGDQPPPQQVATTGLSNIPIEAEVEMSSPISVQRVRIAVLREPGTRRVLSEDLALMRSLAGVFGFMLENLRLQHKRQEQDLVAKELRLQTSRSELKALRAQINPHFLFNALNAIASLIHTDPARADEVVEQLAEVFRYTLRRSESEWAPLDQELAFARAYLDVEQARFGQRLTCTIDSDHLPPAPQVPSMMLQTLIENAVKHGVSQAREPGRIDVVVRTSSAEIAVEVRNTGPGANARNLEPREGEGFGLKSVRERLRGYFGERASLSLSRDEQAGVTIARIVMPVVKVAA